MEDFIAGKYKDSPFPLFVTGESHFNPYKFENVIYFWTDGAPQVEMWNDVEHLSEYSLIRIYKAMIESCMHKFATIQICPDEQCAICWQTNTDRQLTCNGKHKFHTACIKAHFKSGITCPMCRHSFLE
jgi:hypothetical protein